MFLIISPPSSSPGTCSSQSPLTILQLQHILKLATSDPVMPGQAQVNHISQLWLVDYQNTGFLLVNITCHWSHTHDTWAVATRQLVTWHWSSSNTSELKYFNRNNTQHSPASAEKNIFVFYWAALLYWDASVCFRDAQDLRLRWGDFLKIIVRTIVTYLPGQGLHTPAAPPHYRN